MNSIHRTIPVDATRHDTESAIQSLTGFTQYRDVSTNEDVSILNAFIALNNLTLSELMERINMVCIEKTFKLIRIADFGCDFFQNCHDFILRYYILGETVDCTRDSCPLWQKILTVYGACCSFNYYPPFISRLNATKINQVGQLSGLSILFSSEKFPDSGLSLIITNAGAYVMPYNNMFTLFPGFDNFFNFGVKRYGFHPNFRRLTFQSRRCMISNSDKRLRSRSYCVLNYTLEIIYKECKCHPYYIPHLSADKPLLRNCTVNDLLCFRHEPGNYPIVSMNIEHSNAN